MKVAGSLLGILLACMALPGSAYAEPGGRSFGDWFEVSEGERCIAGTQSGDAKFRVLFDDTSNVVFVIGLRGPIWQGPVAVEFSFDANFRVWLEGEASEDFVIVAVPNDDGGRIVLSQLIDASSLSVFGPLGGRIAQFGLVGSGRALKALWDCHSSRREVHQ